MNQKNPGRPGKDDGTRSARERLREQREADRAREKRKRTLIAAVAVVAVLGIAAGVSALVKNSGNDKGKDQQASGPAVAPKGATGDGNVVIPEGKPAAKATLTVYEDFRCPGCGGFEAQFHDTIRELQDKGQLKTEYHLVTIIDGNMGGTGSLNAANAAGCAQDAGKFPDYHDLLYKNQPDEREDAFADKAHLIELAGQVKGLDTPSFRKCVNDGTHDSWVKKSNEAFGKSSYHATPTVLLDGKNIYADQNNPLTPDKLKKMVADADKK
ncbi:thioredoxin domain-containing protein [Streptomyces sp. NPDC050617]|uniref:DsbA family protein n=1 Tax=Streptomyces sp. NPDC050617 TaxID=3154628 RepID=UPI00341A69FB